MQECYIVRRGGGAYSKKVSSDYIEGPLTMEGTFEEESPLNGYPVTYENERINYNYVLLYNNNLSDITVSFNSFTGETMSYTIPAKNVSVDVEGYEDQYSYTTLGMKIIPIYGTKDDFGFETFPPNVSIQKEYTLNKIENCVRQYANDYLIGPQDGTHFVKRNDGKALSFQYYSSGNYPLLIGKTESAVRIKKSDEQTDNTQIYTCLYNTDTYYIGIYYSNIDWYNKESDNALDLGLFNAKNTTYYDKIQEQSISSHLSLGGLAYDIINNFGYLLEEGE